jgi:hypothetical protein
MWRRPTELTRFLLRYPIWPFISFLRINSRYWISFMRLSTLLLGLLPLGAWASNVLELDTSNFDNYVGAGKPPALVEL